MIKNVIFDVGLVLVDFDWKSVFEELGIAGAAFEAVAEATVLSREWNEFDRGVMSDPDILAGFIAHAPEHEEQIRAFWSCMGKTIRTYPYSRNWLRGLEESGFHTYLLSNFPGELYRQSEAEMSFVREVSGALFSYTVKTVKPEPEIYRILMERYGLKAPECVFIDDRPVNLVTARELGMETIHFTGYEQAVEELKKLGVVTA